MKRICNSKGEPIVLNSLETAIASYLQRICNDNPLGANIDITTMTMIMKRVVEQKFFNIPFADFLPVRVGEGAWSNQLLTFRSFATGGDFEEGVLNSGIDGTRLASASAGVDSVAIKTIAWAKEIGWTLVELAQASRSGNWDIVTAKEKARKKNWDLGLQRIAFLGSVKDTSVKGLFNQAGITTDASTISSSIASTVSTPANLVLLMQSLLQLYRSNCLRTAMPTHFVIPESEMLAMASPTSPSFPIKNIYQLMLETFQQITGNPNFKIMGCAYGDKAHNDLGVNIYALYNADEDSIRMDIPVDYTNTLANTVNGFQFNNVGYGQFTGVLAYRPKEMMYFTRA